MGVRNTREMRTIGACLDALLSGNLPVVGDILMQRLKSLEQAVKDGNWQTATHLEVIPDTDVGLASHAEMRAAVKSQVQKAKLKDLTGKARP